MDQCERLWLQVRLLVQQAQVPRYVMLPTTFHFPCTPSLLLPLLCCTGLPHAALQK